MKNYLPTIGIAALLALGAAGLTTSCIANNTSKPKPVQAEESRGRSRSFVESEGIVRNIDPADLFSKREVSGEDKTIELKPNNYLNNIVDMADYKSTIDNSDKHAVVVFYDSSDEKDVSANSQALRIVNKLNTLFSDYTNFFAVDKSKVKGDIPAEYQNGPEIVWYKNNDFTDKPEENLVYGKEKGSEFATLASFILPVNEGKRIPLSELMAPKKTKRTGVTKVNSWGLFQKGAYEKMEKGVTGALEQMYSSN